MSASPAFTDGISDITEISAPNVSDKLDDMSVVYDVLKWDATSFSFDMSRVTKYSFFDVIFHKDDVQEDKNISLSIVTCFDKSYVILNILSDCIKLCDDTASMVLFLSQDMLISMFADFCYVLEYLCSWPLLSYNEFCPLLAKKMECGKNRKIVFTC